MQGFSAPLSPQASPMWDLSSQTPKSRAQTSVWASVRPFVAQRKLGSGRPQDATVATCRNQISAVVQELEMRKRFRHGEPLID